VSSRLKLLLIFAACAAPFVLGTLAYVLDWAPGATANHGELITPPRPLAGAPLDTLRGKWVLVAFDAAACDARCERKLYFMRQVRRAQGKEMGRVERLWVLTDTAAPKPALVAALENARIVQPQSREFVANFPGNPAEHIYLIDPLGNLMLRFPKDPDPSKMIKDLQRLLKYSRVG
jgi:cytochrome oxidase Cu insertion factor (SCO1/SenC/PrrC family)